MHTLYRLIVVSVLLAACGTAEKKPSALFDAELLPRQTFTINNERDTTLRSEGGVRLHISKGSFSGNGPVEVVFREALSLPDMIRGGLATVSDGKPLSSAGMFYFAAADTAHHLQRAVCISVPSVSADTAMQLFRGDTSSGIVNWVEPQPLPNEGIVALARAGKPLFERNCQTCHALDKKLTGPALQGFKARGPWADQREVYKWVHNPAAYIPTRFYTKVLQAQYGPIMQSFPQLSNQAIDAITAYCNGPSAPAHAALADSACLDSCARYQAALDLLWGMQSDPKQTALLGEETVDAIGASASDYYVDTTAGNTDTTEGINATSVVESSYYQVSINTEGWYNLDKYYHLAETGNGHLTVSVNADSANKFEVYLAVVADQVLNPGTPMQAKEKTWCFFNDDGSIALPQGAIVLVFAVDAHHEQVRFDFRQFRYTGSHDIELQPRTYGPEAFNQVLQSLMPRGSGISLEKAQDFDQLPRMAPGVPDTSVLPPVRSQPDSSLQKAQEAVDRLRPKNCNCGVGEFVTMAFSAK